jgi:hypothetical protein
VTLTGYKCFCHPIVGLFYGVCNLLEINVPKICNPCLLPKLKFDVTISVIETDTF